MAKINKQEQHEYIQADKSRLAVTNMGFKDNPPPFISIVGPDSSGKSTLCASIVKNLLRRDVSIVGPVYVKKSSKRYCFYESSNAFDNIVDTLKVSDLIIFTINLEVGLQKETLETINIMNSIGVPKFCFALTHYDSRKSNKSMNEITKRLQKEFSFPIKHFCLEVEGNLYKNVDKLVRFIEVLKYRPIEWKCKHPHIVVDRVENNNIYGYIRGGPICSAITAHVPGVGDVNFKNISLEKDPCPLDSKGSVFYCPNNTDHQDESSTADNFEIKEDNFKFFEDENLIENLENDVSDSDNESYSYKTSSDSSIEDMSEEKLMQEESSSSQDQLNDLKESLKGRFKTKALEQDDYEQKFNEEYKEKEDKDLNILETLKKKEMQRTNDIAALDGMMLPGCYVKIEGNLNYVPENILVIGTVLSTEGKKSFLKGNVIKNKWQKLDLKTNAPYFISMGWYRFQTIPIFTKDQKLIKYCRQVSDIIFYGPSVPTSTSFFIYDLSSNYHIIATGQVLNTSGTANVKKKLKLIGHPREIIGQNVIVQSMFSSSIEAYKFLNAKIQTASGLRGLIKTVQGKDGAFRAVFEGSLLMSDTVFLKVFVPTEPYKYCNYVHKNGDFIRSLKDIKAEMNIPLYEESFSEESASFEDFKDEKRIRQENNKKRELRILESKLPFSKREIKQIRESLELPVPPEQRHNKEFNNKLNEAKEKKIKADQDAMAKKLEMRKKKKIEEQEEKNLRKAKSAVKSHLEKKKHKRSKRK